jgi:hypothetical protein
MTAPVIDQILPHLRVERRKGDEHICWCPLHADGQGRPPHEPNLHVSERGWYCHVCKEGGSLRELAERLNIPLPPTDEQFDAVFDYTDEAGKLLFQVVRRSGKRFSQRQPDGAGGWTWNLQGVRRVLYHLPDIIARSQEIVWITEGEKDAEHLARQGLLATTNSGGAGKWRPEYSETLRDRDVVILSDNDPPGREHGQQVAASLHGIARSVKVIELPGLPEHGDVSDWLKDGHSVDELKALVESTPEWQPAGQALVQEAPALPEPERAAPPLPVLQEIVWRGLFLAYRAAMDGVTEANDSFHFLAFTVAAGAVLGRTVCVHAGRPVYPNINACLAGRSGDSRKSTAIDLGRRNILEQADRGVETHSGLHSAEGLLAAFPEVGPDAPDRRLLVIHQELATILRKARQEGLSNLIPLLCELYDGAPHYSLKTRKDPLEVEQPFLSILAASSPEHLEKSLRDEDILGGFVNRFIFALGAPKDPLPFPNEPDFQRLGFIVDSLREVRQRTSALWLENNKQPVALAWADQAARDVWGEYYLAQRRRDFPSETIAMACARNHEHVLKVALIMAVLEGADSISADVIRAAIAAGQFFEACTRRLFGDMAMFSPLAERVKALVAEMQPVSKRTLHQRLSGRVRAETLNREISALVNLGVLREVPREGRGPTSTLLAVV